MSTVLTDVNGSCACIAEGRFWPGLRTYESWHRAHFGALSYRPSDNMTSSFLTFSLPFGNAASTPNTNQRHQLIQKCKTETNLKSMCPSHLSGVAANFRFRGVSLYSLLTL